MPKWKETDRVTLSLSGMLAVAGMPLDPAKHPKTCEPLRPAIPTRWYCRVCGEGLPFPECFCYGANGECPHAAPETPEPMITEVA